MLALLGLRSFWWRLQAARAARAAGRRKRWAAAGARRERRLLRRLGSVPAHCQSRYGMLKSREEAL